MEKSGVTSTEEGKESEKQHQVNVDLLFDQKGNVHKESVLPGQTVNAAFYMEVLRRLHEIVRRK
jgi:peroxiredoxin